MSLAEVAQAIGIVLGSGAAAYLTARSVVRNRTEPAAVPGAPLAAPTAPTAPTPTPTPSLPDQVLLGQLEQELRTLRTELRSLESDVSDALRTAKVAQEVAGLAVELEEFEAYTKMDTDRRERLISSIGEIKGQLALVLKRM